MLSRLSIAALWSPAGKGLTSWLLLVILSVFVFTLPCGILGQVCYLIVSFLIFAVLLTLIGSISYMYDNRVKTISFNHLKWLLWVL